MPQRAGFDLAADPRYRVFVILVDIPTSGTTRNPESPTIGYIEQPLVNFLERVLGPSDLYGFLTSRNTAKDLVLGQKTVVVESQIRDLFRVANMGRDDADELDRCQDGSALKGLFRADALYSVIEGVVAQLGSLRQERKNIILVTNNLPRGRPNTALLNRSSTNGRPPAIGVTNGRIGIGAHDNPTAANDVFCSGELQRLANMNFDDRYRDLLHEARAANVAFYPITPMGLSVQWAVTQQTDDLLSLAHETDGVAIVNTNDLDGGVKRIADDLSAYYLLGYYTTNTKWDGGIRTIKVKLKSSGAAVRARRQYRAPTQEEMNALAAVPATPASENAPPRHADLIGAPAVYRVFLHAQPQQAGTLEFSRTDRIRIEWPLLALADRRIARVLGRNGKPLPIELPLTEANSGGGTTLATELPLAPFARGDYQIELTATAGNGSDQEVITIRIR